MLCLKLSPNLRKIPPPPPPPKAAGQPAAAAAQPPASAEAQLKADAGGVARLEAVLELAGRCNAAEAAYTAWQRGGGGDAAGRRAAA